MESSLCMHVRDSLFHSSFDQHKLGNFPSVLFQQFFLDFFFVAEHSSLCLVSKIKNSPVQAEVV